MTVTVIILAEATVSSSAKAGFVLAALGALVQHFGGETSLRVFIARPFNS